MELVSIVISFLALIGSVIAWSVSQSRLDQTINEASRANNIAQSARDQAIEANTTASLAMEHSKHVFRVEKLTEIAKEYNEIRDTLTGLAIKSKQFDQLINGQLRTLVINTERYYLPMLGSTMPSKIYDLKLKIIDFSESVVIYFYTQEGTLYMEFSENQSQELLEAAIEERKKTREKVVECKKQLEESMNDVINQISQILVVSTERAATITSN